MSKDDWFGEDSNKSSPSNDWDLSMNSFDNNPTPKGKKKKSKSKLKWIAISGVLVVGLGFTGIKLLTGDKVTAEETPTYELSNFNADIQSASVDNLNAYVDDSYLALEWEYFNDREVRQDFYTKVMSSVGLKLEEEVILDSSNTAYVDIEHVDWVKVTNDMRDFDFKKIQSMYNDNGIKKSNYEFKNEMIDLFSSYILSLETLPVTQTPELPIPMRSEVVEDKTVWRVTDDSSIDRLLFSSNEFHTTLDVFGGIATGDIGTLEVNPNWTLWSELKTGLETQLEVEKSNLSKFNKAVRNNNGTVLLKDKEGNLQEVLNLNGVSSESDEEQSSTILAPVVDNPDLNIVTAIENQLSVMIQNEPLETYIKTPTKVSDEWTKWSKLSDKEKESTEEPTKSIEVTLTPEANVHYKWVGAYYLQNELEEPVQPELGDGSTERPLGFNTPIVTKMKASNGSYHDVRVKLSKMLTNKEAIDYAVSFDERNRGFDESSDLTLMVIEFTVENLEDKELILDSEFTLSDDNANLIPRTGSMYNFAERTKFAPKETKTMQDWFYTQNLDSKYLIWGKSFKREIPEKWFRVLAGDIDNLEVTEDEQ